MINLSEGPDAAGPLGHRAGPDAAGPAPKIKLLNRKVGLAAAPPFAFSGAGQTRWTGAYVW